MVLGGKVSAHDFFFKGRWDPCAIQAGLERLSPNDPIDLAFAALTELVYQSANSFAYFCGESSPFSSRVKQKQYHFIIILTST